MATNNSSSSKATAVKLHCPENRFDGMQLWLTHHEISANRCVLITGPTEVHLIEKPACHICSTLSAPYMIPELAEFFKPLNPTYRTRQYEFFKKHAYNFREDHLKYLTVPLVLPHAVTYLGISHVSSAAIADLLQMTIQNFHIDCENNRLCINLSNDSTDVIPSATESPTATTRKRKKI